MLSVATPLPRFGRILRAGAAGSSYRRTENGKQIALRFACLRNTCMRTHAKKDRRWISTPMDIECITDCLAIRPVSHYFGCMAGAALVKIGNTFLRIHQLASD